MSLVKIPNSIGQVLTDDFKVFSLDRDLSEDAFIVFKIFLNKTNKLFQNTKYIEFNFLDLEFKFKSQFPKESRHFQRADENNTRYRRVINKEDFILKDTDHFSKLYTSYQSDFKLDSSSNFRIEFDAENFNEDSKIYFAKLGISSSREIINRSKTTLYPFNSINISFLDEKNNVIDSSGFKSINMNINNLKSKIDPNSRIEFLRYYVDIFKNSLNLQTLFSNSTSQIVIRNDSRVFRELEIKEVDVNLIFTNKRTNLSKYFIVTNLDADYDRIIFDVENENFLDFCSAVGEDYLNQIQTYDFDLSIKLTSNNSIYNQIEVEINKQFSKESLFVENLFNFSSNIILNRAIGNEENRKIISSYAREDNKVNIFYDFSNVNSKYYDNIKIKNIKINNTNLNFFYKNKNFSIENKVFYKSLPLSSLIDSNNIISLWRNLNSQNIDVTFEFEFDQISNIRRINFETIYEVIDETNYNNIINQTNLIFKNNLNYSNIKLNTHLQNNNTDQYLFNFDRFALANIEYLEDFAFNYGYKNIDEESDIVSFLNNCVLKIESKNRIDYNQNSISNFHSKFIFLRNFFDLDNVVSDTIYSKQLTQNTNTSSSDYFLAQEIQNDHLRDFLLLPNSLTNATKNLTKLEDLNISKNLKIMILPIPKIIIDNLKSGITLEEGRTALISYSSFDSEADADRLNMETVKYFYTNNPSLSYDKFNRFISTLYSDDVENNITANKFAEMFEELLNANIDPKNFFDIDITFNKDEVIRSLDLGSENSFLNSNIFDTLSNQKPKSQHFDLQIRDNTVRFIDNEVPFEFEISDYNLELNTDNFLFRKINIIRNLRKAIKIDLTTLENIFSDLNFREQIFDVNLNFSFHFLLTNEVGIINLQDIDSEKYNIVDLNGDQYITYNQKYVDSYPDAFNYFTYNTEGDLLSENDMLILKPDYDLESDNSIDFSVFREFFEFCISNNLSFLKKILLRTTLNFKFFDNSRIHNVRLFLSEEVLRKNLINENLKINNLENITKQIVNFV